MYIIIIIIIIIIIAMHTEHTCQATMQAASQAKERHPQLLMPHYAPLRHSSGPRDPISYAKAKMKAAVRGCPLAVQRNV
jgi:hypothetical protein